MAQIPLQGEFGTVLSNWNSVERTSGANVGDFCFFLINYVKFLVEEISKVRHTSNSESDIVVLCYHISLTLSFLYVVTEKEAHQRRAVAEAPIYPNDYF